MFRVTSRLEDALGIEKVTENYYESVAAVKARLEPCVISRCDINVTPAAEGNDNAGE